MRQLLRACSFTLALYASVMPLSCSTVEAHSLTGNALTRPQLGRERRNELEANLATARAAWDAQPDRMDLAIWVGRRLAYLGRYQESILWYTQCIARYGETAELLRHRGHRFITVRELAPARADLTKASLLTADSTDSVEADGIPTPAGPRSTLHGNIEYHLALACFCEGQLDAAAAAWSRARELSTNDDTLVAVSYWLAITHFERGDRLAAFAAIDAITTTMDVRENKMYQQLCLLFKGAVNSDDLRARDNPLGIGIDRATLGFGRAMRARHILLDEAAAQELLHDSAQLSDWAAFGVIASEAMLKKSTKASD